MKHTQAEGAGLAFVLACAGIGLAFISLGIASNACSVKNGKCNFTDESSECTIANTANCPNVETIIQQYATYAGFQQIINLQFILQANHAITIFYINCFTDSVSSGTIFTSIITGTQESDFDCVTTPVSGNLNLQ